MSVSEFDKFVNKKVKIEYHNDPNKPESKKSSVGFIDTNIHAGKREIRLENGRINDFVPLSFNFLIEENNQTINIHVRDLIDIEYVE